MDKAAMGKVAAIEAITSVLTEMYGKLHDRPEMIATREQALAQWQNFFVANTSRAIKQEDATTIIAVMLPPLRLMLAAIRSQPAEAWSPAQFLRDLHQGGHKAIAAMENEVPYCIEDDHGGLALDNQPRAQQSSRMH